MMGMQLMKTCVMCDHRQAADRFLRERMHGEGNTMRHLASMGYRLGYVQDPRTEFDFIISNMATDLRSGVRLLRAVELLTGTPTLTVRAQ
jgi:hypothetical protein